jgi:hypothetical protein
MGSLNADNVTMNLIISLLVLLLLIGITRRVTQYDS